MVVTLAAGHVDEIRELVRSSTGLLPRGGGSKPALSAPPHDGVVTVDVSGLRGIVAYDPAELTLTARAGTPVAELDAALAEHGQHLPFDPPLARAGATLGGVVAAATSGPGALRSGGVRDFVIGVRIVDGTGRLVSGGGRVVKNAAGFDLPKLMVGSRGRLGVIVEVSLKVFPRPRAAATLEIAAGGLDAAVAAATELSAGPWELDALELHPDGRLLARLAGDPEPMEARLARLVPALPAGATARRLAAGEADARWREAADLAWRPGGTRLVRAACTPAAIAPLWAAVAAAGGDARFGRGGAVAWIAWPDDAPLDPLDAALREHGLAACALTGAPAPDLLGAVRGGAFAQRVRAALDPDRRFLD
ncbi:MAG: FAD-binding protein [Solirubrobacteraceae bacterium]|nr:FAD-binding protein [Solirubrobacteraceae bacterium]